MWVIKEKKKERRTRRERKKQQQQTRQGNEDVSSLYPTQTDSSGFCLKSRTTTLNSISNMNRNRVISYILLVAVWDVAFKHMGRNHKGKTDTPS